MATASCVTSPLCTWLGPACMSVTCGGDQSTCPSMLGSSSYMHSNKRLFGSKWGRRKKRVFLSKCSSELQSQRDLVSSLCGSSFQGLTTSCRAFEPCDQYYASNASFSSLFGSGNVRVPSNRRHTRFNRAVHSGEAMAVAVQPSKEVATKKKPVTKQRRVVVTGMGVVTPLGHDPDVFYNNLLECVSGVSEIEAFDCAQFPMRIAGEIKSFSTDGWVAPKLSKRMDKFMLHMLSAGKKALADGGITEDVMNELDKVRCGVLIGSAISGMKVFNDAIEALRISYKKMNPFCVPFATTNMGSAMLAMDLVNLLFFNFVIHLDGFWAGVILCVEKALAQSGVSREDVNYINAHATSTPAGELKEYQALLQCFGQTPELRVNSTKSMIGHLLGSAGVVEAVAATQLRMQMDQSITHGVEVIAPKRHLVFAYYLTGHGFGHATRAVEVVRHLIRAGHDVHMVTGAPDFVFTSEIQSPRLLFRKVVLDCGAVQADALTVDPVASLEKYFQMSVLPRASVLATEVQWLNSIKADLVISDVVPIACRAAADAGIRSVCVTNFSWDFIYAEYVMMAGSHYRSVLQQIAEDYSHSEFVIRLPGYCPMPAFRGVIDVPLVVRRLHKSREEVRKDLGVPDDVKLVIFNFGGQPAGWKLKEEYLPAGWLCLVCGASDNRELPPNFIKLAKDVYTPDLIAASDCMLGKIGYGTVSEAMAYKVPFIFIRRDYFNEEPYLREMLEYYQGGVEMARRDMLSGCWIPYLERAVNLKPCYEGGTNGAGCSYTTRYSCWKELC
ncbi:uncharacterized protein LOC126706004 isoform X2 [Quercus robur]|uniref:uncharacterized protein LOC126706004 isoform X2 n=1 Tax=Quercus robur TaxID=38942 RepID=UPI002163DC71|nr:uncharacterized protein LOC126706004 isoform X2 [Quercus robur]XP_050261210.1 uncharacterized protein LOC126706004 isoform X2 [Quercus robur]XP_050261211.1 uncharacterized protein LOC126706004 isoform X2 [Quercus robur]